MGSLIQKKPLTKPSLEKSPKFVHIQRGSKYFYLVRNFFSGFIQHLYGNQDMALKKILDSSDRVCEIMFLHGNPVGILVYKKSLQEEHGLKQTFEVKTVGLLNPEKNSGKGMGKMLIARCQRIANTKNAKTIFLTCHEESEQPIQFFKSQGFQIKEKLSKLKQYLLVKRC